MKVDMEEKHFLKAPNYKSISPVIFREALLLFWRLEVQ